MEPANPVSDLPFEKGKDYLRPGQLAALNMVVEPARKKLAVQLPTGYGKTVVALASFAVLRNQERVDRMLILFPTDAQKEQFKRRYAENCSLSGLVNPGQFLDLAKGSLVIETELKRNNITVLLGTIQQAIQWKPLGEHFRRWMHGHQWLVVLDEYHHYGNDGIWGKLVKVLPATFLLAMSATPYRQEDDSAVGIPDLIVKYRQAAEQGYVKPLCGHCYIYVVDLVDGEGNIESITLKELYDQAAQAYGHAATPQEIDTYIQINRRLRFSSKYISPLVSMPIERLIEDRSRTDKRLQAIIGAASVVHAKVICEQVRTMFPFLKTEWVGTGPEARGKENDGVTNAEIVERFLNTNQPDYPESQGLDVLVHVSIAGEGLDADTITEVIHCNAASICNQNNQENGRASRVILDNNGKPFVGHINFDNSSEYAPFTGARIMNVLDGERPLEDGDEDEFDFGDDDKEEWEPKEMKPGLPMWNDNYLRFVRVDHGIESLGNFGDFMVQKGHYPRAELENARKVGKEHPFWKTIMDDYLMAQGNRAVKLDAAARLKMAQHDVMATVSSFARTIRFYTLKKDVRPDKALVSDIIKRINSRKAYEIGPIKDDWDTYLKHKDWLVTNHNHIMQTKRLPLWAI